MVVAADPSPRVAAARDENLPFQLLCWFWDEEAFEANALAVVFLAPAMIGYVCID
jgi:hypothetical protein